MSILLIKSCCRLHEERINTAISVPPGGWLLPQRNDLIRGASLLRPGYCVCSVTPNSVTSWTVAHCSPLSMEFSGQDYWNRLFFSPLGDLPDLEWTHVSCISWIGRRILFFFTYLPFIYTLFFFFLTLQYCIGFAIYQHEPTNGVLLRWILYYWGIHQNSWLN